METNDHDTPLDTLFKDFVKKIAPEKDAKIAQLKRALLKIKEAVDEAIRDIDLEVTAEPPKPVEPEKAPEPARKPASKAIEVDEHEKPTGRGRGVDTPLLVDLAQDLDARPFLEGWAEGKHHLRYKLAEHLASIGYEAEGAILIGQGEVTEGDAMAASHLIKTCVSYDGAKANEQRMLRGAVEKLFGKWS